MTLHAFGRPKRAASGGDHVRLPACAGIMRSSGFERLPLRTAGCEAREMGEPAGQSKSSRANNRRIKRMRTAAGSRRASWPSQRWHSSSERTTPVDRIPAPTAENVPGSLIRPASVVIQLRIRLRIAAVDAIRKPFGSASCFLDLKCHVNLSGINPMKKIHRN